jgi:ClpP class serine protease
LISVQGGLMPRGSWFGSSLDGLRSQIRRAANDGDVAAIVLDIDSPGGTMETAAEVKAATAQKPVIAIANTLAASAAYWIGSQASEAVARGMADRVATLDDVIAGLAQKIPVRSRRRSALVFD